MLSKGCFEVAADGYLEAPIYSNQQIEAAWLFLFEVRRRYFNRRKQIQELSGWLAFAENEDGVVLSISTLLRVPESKSGEAPRVKHIDRTSFVLTARTFLCMVPTLAQDEQLYWRVFRRR